jgi:hypothetical protein
MQRIDSGAGVVTHNNLASVVDWEQKTTDLHFSPPAWFASALETALEPIRLSILAMEHNQRARKRNSRALLPNDALMPIHDSNNVA